SRLGGFSLQVKARRGAKHPSVFEGTYLQSTRPTQPAGPALHWSVPRIDSHQGPDCTVRCVKSLLWPSISVRTSIADRRRSRATGDRRRGGFGVSARRSRFRTSLERTGDGG